MSKLTNARFTLNNKEYVVTSAGRGNIRYRTANTAPEEHVYYLSTIRSFDAFVVAGLIKFV